MVHQGSKAWPGAQGFEVEDKEAVPVEQFQKLWNKSQDALVCEVPVPGMHWKGHHSSTGVLTLTDRIKTYSVGG